MSKLTPSQIHILGLVQRDADSEGWTKVSAMVAQLFTNSKHAAPAELFEFQQNEDGSGRARLTETGLSVMNARAYL